MKLDDLEAQILGHTRREMAPSAEDASRVRRALAAQLGAAAIGTAANASAAGGFWASFGTAKTTLLVLTALGGGAAALGWSARARDAPPPVASSTNARTADTTPNVELRARTAPAEQKTPSTKATPARAESSPARPAPVPSVAAANAPPNALADEVRLLERADRALRQGAPDVARRLLDELSTSHPNGQLLEERAATETLLACQQKRNPRAQSAARAFLSAHPASVYAARIRVACLESSGDE